MTPPIRLLDERLRITSDTSGTVDSGFDLTDADARSARALTPRAPGELFNVDPGLALSLDGTVSSGMSVADLVELPTDVTDLSSAAALARAVSLMPATRVSLSGGLSASITPPDQPLNGPVFSLRVRADAAASASATSQDFSAIADTLTQAAAAETVLSGLYADMRQLFSDWGNSPALERLQATHGEPTTPEGWTQLFNDIGEVSDLLRRTDALLDRAEGGLDQANALVDRMSETVAVRAGGTVRGSVEGELSVRRRFLISESGDRRAHLTVGASARASAPLPAPPGVEMAPGMHALRSSMVAMSAMVSVTGRGLGELRDTLRAAGPLLADASALVRDVRGHFSELEDPAVAADVERRVSDLEARGSALADRAEAAIDDPYADMHLGMRVTEATGPSVGLSEAGAELSLTSGSSFELAVALTLHNIAGRMPGLVSDYALATTEDGNVTLALQNERETDVFATFYPATVEISGRAHVALGSHASLEARGRIETALRSGRSTGSAGLIARIGGFYLGAGFTFGALPARALLSTGYSGDHLRIGLDAGLDVDALTGAAPETWRAASLRLSASLNF